MSKYSRGIQFENEAFNKIAEELNANYIFDYYLIQDVAYKGMNRYEQVDCMLICSYGIYCFEMKNWKGDVKPSNEDKWPIYMYGRRTNREFPNPIRQNERHCAYLKYLLDKYYPEFKNMNIPIFSIILFSDRTQILNSKKENVMYIEDVPRYIMKHNIRIPEVMCTDVFKVIKQIKEQCLPEYQKLHLHQIKTLN